MRRLIFGLLFLVGCAGAANATKTQTIFLAPSGWDWVTSPTGAGRLTITSPTMAMQFWDEDTGTTTTLSGVLDFVPTGGGTFSGETIHAGGIDVSDIQAGAGDQTIVIDSDEAGGNILFKSNGITVGDIGQGGFSLFTGTAVNEFSTDATMAGNSTNAIPVESAIVGYAMPFTGGIFTDITTHTTMVATTATITNLMLESLSITSLEVTTTSTLTGDVSMGADLAISGGNLNFDAGTAVISNTVNAGITIQRNRGTANTDDQLFLGTASAGVLTWQGSLSGARAFECKTAGAANIASFNLWGSLGRIRNIVGNLEIQTDGGAGDIFFKPKGTTELTAAAGVVTVANDLDVGGDLEVTGASDLGVTEIGDGTNDTDFAADGFMTATGDAQWTKHAPFNSTRVKLAGVSDPAVAIIGISSVLEFDAATDEEVFGELEIPTDYVAGTDLQVHFHWAPTDGNAGNVTWGIEWHLTRPENNEVLTEATTTQIIVDAAQSLADEHLESGAITLDGTGIAPDSMIHMRLFRDANASEGGASDTYAADAAFIEIEFAYMANRHGADTRIP